MRFVAAWNGKLLTENSVSDGAFALLVFWSKSWMNLSNTQAAHGFHVRISHRVLNISGAEAAHEQHSSEWILQKWKKCTALVSRLPHSTDRTALCYMTRDCILFTHSCWRPRQWRQRLPTTMRHTLRAYVELRQLSMLHSTHHRTHRAHIAMN